MSLKFNHTAIFFNIQFLHFCYNLCLHLKVVDMIVLKYFSYEFSTSFSFITFFTKILLFFHFLWKLSEQCWSENTSIRLKWNQNNFLKNDKSFIMKQNWFASVAKFQFLIKWFVKAEALRLWHSRESRPILNWI